MNQHKPYFIIIMFFFAAGLFAQNAQELDVLLETKELSAAQAARFVLGAAELIPEYLSGQAAETEAFNAAVEKGWLRGSPADALKLRDLSFLVMNAFNFKGGLMYSLFHTPRYAHREMVYRKLIQGRTDPGLRVSGERMLQIIGQALSYSGQDAQLDAEMDRGDFDFPEAIGR